MDDQELGRRWELVGRHRGQALRVALARTRNRADAEDLVHEAMIKAVSVEELREETAAGLLSTIVIRLAVDLHRRTATHRKFEAVLSAEPTGTVDERVTDEAEAAWLAGQLIHLPVREREVLLHRAAGHSNASTAAVLGLTYKSVESAFTRARGQLQLAWKATAALVLGFAAAIRKAGGRSALATATLAASICVIAVLEQPSPDTSSPLVIGGDLDTAELVSPVSTTAQLPVDRATATSTGSTGRTGAAAQPQPRPAADPIISTPPIGDPNLVQLPSVTVGREGDGTFMEHVQTCVDGGLEGISIDPDTLGCKAMYEPRATPTPSASPSPAKDHS
jgi:RNA polymerase sigma-70 factor (ECF subfamily)